MGCFSVTISDAFGYLTISCQYVYIHIYMYNIYIYIQIIQTGHHRYYAYASMYAFSRVCMFYTLQQSPYSNLGLVLILYFFYSPFPNSACLSWLLPSELLYQKTSSTLTFSIAYLPNFDHWEEMCYVSNCRHGLTWTVYHAPQI